MDPESRLIVIGASAGGVEALLRIAPRLSPDLEAPILLVLHIGAHRSHLPELLNHAGSNRAVFAQTGTVPRPGTIYVAPSDQHLMLDDGALRLTRGPKEHHARPAINPLFRSAALELGPRAVGVVLTGMLDDGAAGLHAIKVCGGTTVVQDPADAAEPGMPRHALANVAIDHVATADAMADLLNLLARPAPHRAPLKVPQWLRMEHAVSLGKTDMQDLATIGTPSGFTCPDCGGALFELAERQPLRFLCHTGHTFGLQSLASAHDEATDVALWAGLRALQEKEALLRRRAEAGTAADAGSRAKSLAQAEQLAQFIVQMRSLVSSTPDGPESLDT